MIMNSREIYEECGRRAAQAINDHDWARRNHETMWLVRALAIEPDKKYRAMARGYYDEAYKATRRLPT
jgi:hypothetical protein